MNCVTTLEVGALLRFCWQGQLLAARQTALLAAFPRYRPSSSTCSLESPCNRVHFMTIKAGNVVGKVSRRLRKVCASSSAAMLHPVSITCRNISHISSVKIKLITNGISSKKIVRSAKGFLTAKTEWQLMRNRVWLEGLLVSWCYFRVPKFIRVTKYCGISELWGHSMLPQVSARFHCTAAQ